MAKPISDQAVALIQQPTGTDPFIVVEINWGLGSSFYSTQNNDFGYNVNIMEVGSIRNERTSDSMSNVGAVKIKFSDTDGFLKYVIDRRVAERAPAIIWLAFSNMPYANFVPLLVGKTTSPIIWDEHNRTFDLEIETYIDSENIGYSATSNDFDDLSPEAEGVPWPIIFGTCAHVPCLQITKRYVTYLQSTLRFFQDPMYILFDDTHNLFLRGNPQTYAFLDSESEQNVLYVEDASGFPGGGQTIGLLINEVVFYGFFADNHKFFITQANAPRFTDLRIGIRPPLDPDFQNYKVLWLDYSDNNTGNVSIINHNCYFSTAPNANWFNVCVRQEGNKCWFSHDFVTPLPPYNQIYMDDGMKILETYAISKCGCVADIDHVANKIEMVARQGDFGALAHNLDRIQNNGASWWTAEMDTEVKLWDPNPPDIYVASLVPLDSIQAVYGRRRINVNGKSRTIFAPIPESYYNIVDGNYDVAGTRPTAIEFPTPLCEYAGQDWESDVFVSATSTLGPNPADIISWILRSYTNLPVDTFSFARVRSAVRFTPANFAIFDKRDALKIAQEIAFQARCSLVMDRGTIGIVFIPASQVPIALYNESNVKNVVLSFIPTRELMTRLIGSYAETYKDAHHLDKSREKNVREFERLLRSFLPTQARHRSETKYYSYVENVNAFGLKTREEQVYIYNDVDYVQQMVDFWGHRFSNVWRTVSFDTWLEALILQPFDVIEFQFADTTILNGVTVLGVVQSVEFDPTTKVSKVSVILPIKAGLTSVDPTFWLS